MASIDKEGNVVRLFREGEHDKFLIKRIGQMRYHSILTDIVLKVEDREFSAHKNVLAARSDYFMAMFNSQMSVVGDSVVIQEISADAMDLVLEFIYTGELTITEENVEDVFCASCLLLLDSLTLACCQFLEERLTLTNCWGVRTLADKFHCRDMLTTVTRFIQQTFKDVVRRDEYLMLPNHEIKNLLSDDFIVVSSEEEVFDALVRWMNYDVEGRKDDFPALLKVVRLLQVKPEYFEESIARSNLVTESPESQRIVDDARKLFQGDARPNNDLDEYEKWKHPRQCLRFIEVVVTVGGGALSNFFDEKDNTWVPMAPPVTRHCPGMETLDNSIYIVGGSKEWKRYNRCERYDPEVDEWKLIAPMNIGRSNIGLVALNGYLYAVGGYDGKSVVSNVECYNPKKNEWTFIKEMHNCRDGACVVTDGVYIYAISGYDGNNYLGSVEVYDTMLDEWSVGDMPSIVERREDAMAEAVDGKIYVIGGYFNNIFYSSVEELDLETHKWNFKAPMSDTRYHAGSAVINKTIYICGGWTGDGLASSLVECYNILTDTWSKVASLPAPSAARTVACRFPRSQIKKLKKTGKK